MFNVVQWSEELELTDFYRHAASRGYKNNSSQQRMIDTFRNEKQWNAWILYYNDVAVGSVAAHSFDTVMGEHSYRIMARTCVLSSLLPYQSLRTRNQIYEHQNITAQFLIPTCINWVPSNCRMFVTSNESSVGSQRLVHHIFFPTLASKGVVSKIRDVNYRGIDQTVWEMYPDKFLEDLDKYKRWN
jgi:hypothetical protein